MTSEGIAYLPDDSDKPTFNCASCTVPLALQDELVSRSFSGSNGPAFLIRSAINVVEGTREVKVLLTGRHTISSISCKSCQTELGWKYYSTPSSAQKYKELKYILEKDKIYKDNKWTLEPER